MRFLIVSLLINFINGLALAKTPLLFSPTPQDTVQADQYFALAEQLFAEKLYDSAQLWYKKAATLYKHEALWKKNIRSIRKTGQCHYHRHHHDSALLYYEQAIALTQMYVKSENALLTGLLNDAAVSYGKQGDFDLQLQYLKDVITIRVRDLGETNLDVADAYYNLAVAYGRIGRYEQQLSYHEKVLMIRRKLLDKNDLLIAESSNSIGASYENLGKIEKQLQYYKKALVISNRILEESHPLLAKSYNNIGRSCQEKGNLEKALIYYNKSLTIFFKSEKTNKLAISTMYINLGGIYGRKEQYEQQLNYYLKALKIRRELLGKNHYKIANIYNNMAWCYGKQGDFTNRLAYYQKALAIATAKLGEKHPKTVAIYNKLAQHDQEVGNDTQALRWLSKAQEGFAIDWDNKAPSLGHVQAKKTLLNTLNISASILTDQYQYTQNIVKLKKALRQYTLAVQLLDTMRLEFFSEASKQRLAGTALMTYEGGISTAFELYAQTRDSAYLHQAFHFAEKNKSILLLEALLRSRASDFANIPSELVSQESELLSDIVLYQKQLDRAIQKNDSTQINRFSDKLFTLNRTHEQLITKLETEYPKYYDLKYNYQTASISELQADLSDSTLLVNYFVGDSAVFVFGITNTQVTLHRLGNTANLNQQVRNLRACFKKEAIIGVRSAADKQHLFDTYASHSHQVFQSLLRPILEAQSANRLKKIVVIPDGLLHYLPFEALTSEESTPDVYDFRKLSYVINQYQVAYAHSATLFLISENSMLTTDRTATKRFAGFAPNYTGNPTSPTAQPLSSLKHNQDEVKNISKLMDGDIYLGEQATRQIFYEKAAEYEILHLAMHTQIDDENPLYSGFVFSPGDTSDNGHLSVIDLYNWKINARMVTLSACNTGYGTLARGEGIMSMARAFAYTGCPTLINSLWEVPDSKTARIMTSFYTSLTHAKPVDKALREAKLDYLQEKGHAWYTHPYFWAGFVAVGDTTPIITSHENWIAWVVVVVIALMILGYVIFRWQFSHRKKSIT